MYRLGLKMLFADRAKYIMLLSGMAFAALLMTQQAARYLIKIARQLHAGDKGARERMATSPVTALPSRAWP